MRRMLIAGGAVLVLAGWAAWGQEGGQEKPFGQPVFEGGGIQVYTKADFDSANPFGPENSGKIELDGRPEFVISGKCLHVSRAKPTDYFGARTALAIQGSRGLKIGFLVRAKNMTTLALNVFDAAKDDNCTPASAARLNDDQWTPVLFAVEDFWHNSTQPQIKIPANTRFTGMFFHGQESKEGAGEYWIDKFIIYRGVDTQPPESPAEVKAAVKDGKVELTWKEPADNAFCVYYSVYRKGPDGKWTKVRESLHPLFIEHLGSPGKYEYRVTAADFDGNCSAPSDATVTVESVPTVELPAPSVPETDRVGYAENVRKIHAAGEGKVRHDVFLFAGDSITAADAYTFVLGGWLARGVTVRRGVGQMRTDYGKNQIDGYLNESKPEFAIVMYGTNDEKDEKSVAAARENLAAVIDACAKFGTVPIIATIPPRGYEKDKQDGQKRFNEMVVALCQEKKVPVSYCFQEMMSYELKEMLGDGVHLTAGAGNDAAGEALRRTFEQIGFALRDTCAGW